MRVYVDTNELRDAKTKMKSIIDDILTNIAEINKRIEDSKEVFDTPAATVFRESANEYIFTNKKYIHEELIPMVDKLENSADIYQAASDSVKNSVS